MKEFNVRESAVNAIDGGFIAALSECFGMSDARPGTSKRSDPSFE